MAATTEKYRPPFTSQRWQERPLNGCRSLAIFHGRALETLGESVTFATGNPYGKAARVRETERIRKAMSAHKGITVSAAPGFNRDDAMSAIRTLYPTSQAVRSNPTKDELKDWLGRGYGFSLSGDVRDVPDPNPIDNAVNETAHEIFVAPIQNRDGKWLVYEPMNSRTVWATFYQVWTFTKRFRSNGRAFAIRFKAGGDTKAARVQRACNQRKTVLKNQRDNALEQAQAAQDQVTALQAELAAAEDALEASEQALIECRESVPDCDAKVAQARQAALDDAINALVDLQEG